MAWQHETNILGPAGPPGPYGPQGPAGTLNCTVSDTPPTPVQQGHLWWESDSANLYVWYQDQDSGQWIQITGPTGTPGPAGVDGADGAAGPMGPAQPGEHVYASIAAGLAGTVSGETFWVYVTGSDHMHLYLNVAEAAVYQAALGVVPAAATGANELLGDYTAALAIDVTEPGAVEVKVIDPVTPANNYEGDAFDWFVGTSVAFGTTKLCLQQDGSFKFQDNNHALQSEDYTHASWTKNLMTATGGVVGPNGTTTNAFTLTVTNASGSSLSQNIAPLANSWQTQEYYVKKGTSAYCYIAHTNNAVTRRAYFNLTSGLFETVDAGLVARVSNTFPDGTPLASGWFRISAYGFSLLASDVIRLGLSNADNNVATTIGLTLFATRGHYYRGIRQVDYIPTTTVARRGVPYDWTPGIRSIRLDVGASYRGRWSNDMTNAAWTKTSVTADTNAVGPDLTPCSTISATAANGTVIQAVTSSGTQQTFHAWVRRKTGTGTLSLTMDNGASWTDVTADVGAAGGPYRSVYRKGVVANPTVGFRIGTSGDAFEVAFANVVGAHLIPPPHASSTIDIGSSADVFNIPMTKFPTAAGMTLYADVWQHPNTLIGGVGGTTTIGFFGAASLQNVVTVGGLVDDYRLEHAWNNGTLLNEDVGITVTGRLQLQFRMKPNDCAICYNGNSAWWNHLAPAIVLDALKITVQRSLWLRRLLVVPEAVSFDNDELRLFRLDASDIQVNSNLLASTFVAKVVPGSGGILRLPAVSILYERDDICGFICFFGQRADIGWNLEQPSRPNCRRGEFDRSTNTITWLEDRRVLYTPPGYGGPAASATSIAVSANIKIKYGKYRGRLLTALLYQETPGGTPSQMSIYTWYSDDNGATWSAPAMALNIDDFSVTDGFLATGENSTSVQLDYGPHAGRVYFPFSMTNAQHGCMWTDDFLDGGDGSGTNWETTPPYGGPGVGMVQNSPYPWGVITEPGIALRPDNSIVLFFRNSGGGDVAYSVSTDYGQNFTYPVLCAGDALAHNVNSGFLQDDPTGMTGKYGRFMVARSTLGGRIGHKVQQATDAAMTLGNNYQLFSRVRFIGYCALKKAFQNDNIYLCMTEVQPTVSSNVDTSQILVAFRY